MQHCEFSKPVVVDEGVAFCVKRTDGLAQSSAVVVATKARLKVGEEAQGLALLAAFVQASRSLFEEAAMRLKSEAVGAILYL